MAFFSAVRYRWVVTYLYVFCSRDRRFVCVNDEKEKGRLGWEFSDIVRLLQTDDV